MKRTNLIFPDTIYPENLEQYEKTEPKNNRNRRRKRFPTQRSRNKIQQNPNLKK